MLRYLEKEHEEYVARGEEPPFDLADLLRRYAPSPPNSDVTAPPSFSMPAKKSVRPFCFPTKGWLKTFFILLHEFLSCMLVIGIFVFV
jgi:hypothetical protein